MPASVSRIQCPNNRWISAGRIPNGTHSPLPRSSTRDAYATAITVGWASYQMIRITPLMTSDFIVHPPSPSCESSRDTVLACIRNMLRTVGRSEPCSHFFERVMAALYDESRAARETEVPATERVTSGRRWCSGRTTPALSLRTSWKGHRLRENRRFQVSAKTYEETFTSTLRLNYPSAHRSSNRGLARKLPIFLLS